MLSCFYSLSKLIISNLEIQRLIAMHRNTFSTRIFKSKCQLYTLFYLHQHSSLTLTLFCNTSIPHSLYVGNQSKGHQISHNLLETKVCLTCSDLTQSDLFWLDLKILDLTRSDLNWLYRISHIPMTVVNNPIVKTSSLHDSSDLSSTQVPEIVNISLIWCQIQQ